MPPKNISWDEEPDHSVMSSFSTAVDMARALPGGLAQGAAGVVGMPGDISHLLDVGMDKLTGAHVADQPRTGLRLPTSGEVNDAISKPFGGYYQPKTTAGRLAEKTASFVPGVLGGEASLASRLAMRALVPAAGAMAAGSAVDEKAHPYLHTLAEVVGAVGSGSAAELARIGSGRIAAAMNAAREAGDIQAQRKFAELLAKQGHTPDSLAAAAMPAAHGQTAAEAMGVPGVRMAATLARQEGTTGPQFDALLRQRAATRGDRVLDFTGEASGVAPAEAAGKIGDIVQQGRADAKPYFEAAENFTPNTSPKLDILEKNRRVREGMKTGVRNELDLANARGEEFNAPAHAVTDFDAAGDPIIGEVPTWKTRFAGKRGLDQQLEEFRNPLTRELDLSQGPAYAIDQLRRSYVDELKQLNPHYETALAKSADYLSTNSAFKDARNHLLERKMPAAQVQAYFDKLSAADQAAYRAGLSDKMHQLVQNVKSFRPDTLLTPNIQTKLEIAFGKDKAAQFIQKLENENSLMRSGNRIQPGSGSFTFEGMEQGKDLVGHMANVQAASEGAQALAKILSGSPVSGALGLGKAAMHFFPNLARTGGMSVETRNELGRLLAMSPEELRSTMNALPPKPKVNYSRALLGK